MLEKMIVSLIRTKPFYAHFVQQMKRIKTEKIPTLGVNITDRINLFYNPIFLESLTPLERVACLEHEVLHLLNLHLFRRDNKDPELFNIACDLAINTYIENLPKCALLPDQFGLKRNQIAEWYYKELVRNQETLQVKIDEAIQSNLDDHGMWKESDRDAVFKQEFLKRSIKQSLDETQDYGSLPGKLRSELEQFIQGSKVNWKRVLESFVTQATITKLRFTRKRPNRRFDDFPGHKVELKLKLLIGLDTSGSVGEDELVLFFSQIEKIKALGMDITAAECDVHIGTVYPYKTRPESVSGRGGTDFRPVFDLARELNPDAIVYLTDGYGPYPDRSKFPTLWCLTPGGNFAGSFGRSITLLESN